VNNLREVGLLNSGESLSSPGFGESLCLSSGVAATTVSSSDVSASDWSTNPSIVLLTWPSDVSLSLCPINVFDRVGRCTGDSVPGLSGGSFLMCCSRSCRSLESLRSSLSNWVCVAVMESIRSAISLTRKARCRFRLVLGLNGVTLVCFVSELSAFETFGLALVTLAPVPCRPPGCV